MMTYEGLSYCKDTREISGGEGIQGGVRENPEVIQLYHKT